MPGWHAATQKLQDAGDIQMIGIIQEQNADRCRLFMQWQQMDWPVMVDSFDLFEVSVVPLTYAIDEHGIVRFAGLRQKALATLEADFIDQDYGVPRDDAGDGLKPSHPASKSAEDLARAALGDGDLIERSIADYSKLVKSRADDGWAHFRLAVAHRLRYDSPRRRAGDFQLAVDHWQRALDLDPNNYIWRRRIQQYGPRLAKPYPFYDWIETARREIQERGDKPVVLSVDPSGSEIASPIAAPIRKASIVSGAEAPEMSPDPEAKVFGDHGDEAFIQVEPTVVPRRVIPGQGSRVHLVFRPNSHKQAHWNNESEPLRVWLTPPEDWQVERRLLRHQGAPETATSDEVRRLEFEVLAPAGVGIGSESIHAYALYYVCEDSAGACLYRRQDFEIPIEVR